jgi:hypothetical protein
MEGKIVFFTLMDYKLKLLALNFNFNNYILKKITSVYFLFIFLSFMFHRYLNLI